MSTTRKILKPGQVSTLLPREARAALQAASQVDAGKAKGESQYRNAEIGKVTADIKRQYPEFFRREATTSDAR